MATEVLDVPSTNGTTTAGAFAAKLMRPNSQIKGDR